MRHLLLILFVFMSLCTMAQEDTVVPSPQVVELTDSLVDDTVSVSMEQVDKVVQKVKKEKRDWSTWRPDPKRAMWLAIMLPGAGQIYNRKYWKLPIVYGGFLGCIYAMRWNNQMYLDYSQAYLDIMDNDPKTASYEQFLHLGQSINSTNTERYKQIFKSRRDKYRRWRDLSFIAMMAVYALSIVDAYVDASLSQFDISDDLSLRLAPTAINGNTKIESGQNNHAIGMHAALTF
jgi:hypothetical protein